jgi:hypothetical protein
MTIPCPKKILIALLTLATITGAAMAQSVMDCANGSQWKAWIDQLTSDVDWFLSIVKTFRCSAV